jgi:hypothetical protein
MIHRKYFFDSVRASLFGGHLTQQQVDGLNCLIDRADEVGLDYRQFAYVLATTYHETACTMAPIAEYGKGKGYPYGQPAGPYDQCYYGRGFVQLTWLANYQTMQAACGAQWGKDIVQVADHALDLEIATDVIFYGMTHGSFTGRKLSDYINAQGTDFYNARKIVNGTDKAGTIQGYAEKFNVALTWTPCEATAPPPAQAA